MRRCNNIQVDKAIRQCFRKHGNVLIIALDRSILPITLTGTTCKPSSSSEVTFMYHRKTFEYTAQVTTILITIVA